MLRSANLDTTGILHRVIGRGIESKQVLFYDIKRFNFIDVLAALVEAGTAEKNYRAWCDIWLSPEFKIWNIEEYIPKNNCPVSVPY